MGILIIWTLNKTENQGPQPQNKYGLSLIWTFISHVRALVKPSFQSLFLTLSSSVEVSEEEIESKKSDGGAEDIEDSDNNNDITESYGQDSSSAEQARTLPPCVMNWQTNFISPSCKSRGVHLYVQFTRALGFHLILQ